MNTHKIFKYVGLAVVFLGGLTSVKAQQDAQYTQYMYNTVNVNPAYAGSRGVMSIFGLYRAQWVGMEGAPRTAAASINTPIGDTRLGLGATFINDRTGAIDENNISVDVSYSVDLNDNYQLSFGLKGTANLLNVRYGDLKFNPATSYVDFDNISNKFSPNVGAGLYLHSNKTYVGVSVPNFLSLSRSKFKNDNSIEMMEQKMHFYFIAGRVFDLSPGLKFKPAILAKGIMGAPLQLDATANFLIEDKVVIGAGYRWDSAVSGLVGFQITNGLFVGYSYDYDLSPINKYSSGSHEIFMRFELLNRYNRITTPRFF